MQTTDWYFRCPAAKQMRYPVNPSTPNPLDPNYENG